MAISCFVKNYVDHRQVLIYLKCRKSTYKKIDDYIVSKALKRTNRESIILYRNRKKLNKEIDFANADKKYFLKLILYSIRNSAYHIEYLSNRNQ